MNLKRGWDRERSKERSLDQPRKSQHGIASEHTMLYDDVIKGVHSALPRRQAGDESSNHESMGASSGCPEPAKGRSTGCHNGKTGTGDVYVQRTSPFDRIYPLPPTSMTKRKMRTSKSLLVACLPIFASLASAQLIYPNCTAGWEWSYNSLGQNPCNCCGIFGGNMWHWAYVFSPPVLPLRAKCHPILGTFSHRFTPHAYTVFKIDPLPQGSLYRGPDVNQSNLCECNTVVYSLVSSSEWIQWSQWYINCSTVSTDGTYPNSIPAGTRIPRWAYLEVSAADTWNATAAQSTGDTPEGTATTVPSTPSTSVPSSSTSLSSSSNKSSSSTGAIAGGVVGGVVGATVLVGLIIWYTRRRRWRAVARPSPFMTDAPHMAAAFGIPDPGTSTPMPKYYDPSDPSTFPPSLMSPSATVIQTTPGSEQAHGTSTPPLSDRSRYNGLPLV
ncbi:hypothetical protein EDB92DRAFT_1821349 [Lactarius akahatsu]|uniref:Uncharacterized protein n=1 Tax=Lactarius akahatsu TaxID=416441 RepID=A0AAD4L6L1_9AGAM|nr:hypothetical protein EDB92DRAFT_1821349 [Lactarius akahatsu]